MWSRIRYFFSTPREVWAILLISSAIFSFMEVVYYAHYLTTLQGISDEYGQPLGRDFISYWAATQLLRDGDVSGIYSLSVFMGRIQNLIGRPVGMYWRYPPHYLFLLWPFICIGSYKIAYAVWSAINLAAFALAVFWRTSLTRSWRWIMLCSPAVFMELFIGQNGLLTSALLIGGFRLLTPMPWASGVLFGLLSFKPQLGILIPFILLALKQYRAFTSATLTCVLLVLASALAFGWQSWEAFLYDAWHFQSQAGYFAFTKMISMYAAMRSMGWSLSVSIGWQMVVAAFLTLALCYRLCRMRQAHWTEWLRLILPAVYLVTPYAYSYDACALSAAWLLWLREQGERKIFPWATAVWLLLWCVPPCFNQSFNESGLPVTSLLLMLAFIMSWQETSSGNGASCT